MYCMSAPARRWRRKPARWTAGGRQLILNALMMLIVAQAAGRLYQREWGVGQLWLPAALILGTVAIRFLSLGWRKAEAMPSFWQRTVFMPDFGGRRQPWSNLDSLNEAVILRSLKEEAKGKTIALVSHRLSTVRIADEVVSVENGRRQTEAFYATSKS